MTSVARVTEISAESETSFEHNESPGIRGLE
jgi:hypothetical protein